MGGGRARAAKLGRVTVAAHGGYGGDDFIFDGSTAVAGALPSVAYRFVRGGIDARIPVGPLSFMADVAYLGVLSTGPYADLFPHAQVGGIDASAGVGLALSRSFELSLGVRYTRFFYDLRPVPGDAYVAGGTLDEMARLWTGLAWCL
jgi:hypothetical protein